MKKLQNNIRHIILSLAVITITIAVASWYTNKDINAESTDLAITWINSLGTTVSNGDPIFFIEDLKPGDEYSANVSVTNTVSSDRTIAIRGALTDQIGSLTDVLLISIKDDSIIIYGPKSLTEFFEDSEPLGVELTSLSSNDTVDYEIVIQTDPSIGNEHQLNTFSFDITMGTTTESGSVPDECTQEIDGVVIIGSAGRDRLEGTTRNDLIIGLDGNDRIRGHGGDDCIVGGDGEDRLDGGIGDDVILAGNDDDRVDGGNGNDTIYGGLGDDRLDGGNSDDYIEGNQGQDRIEGGNGDDVLHGNEGDDDIEGGNGNDIIY
ncbi:hypothetical protein KC573_04065, partial [candidate division WWE3 bacterium]|nr:hypothetical protein [candidate division WWE3 bacterium]